MLKFRLRSVSSISIRLDRLFTFLGSTKKPSLPSLINSGMPDMLVDITDMEHNTPTTTEQLYYRKLYDGFYPHTAHSIPYFWMPKYVNATDSSARTLDIYN